MSPSKVAENGWRRCGFVPAKDRPTPAALCVHERLYGIPCNGVEGGEDAERALYMDLPQPHRSGDWKFGLPIVTHYRLGSCTANGYKLLGQRATGEVPLQRVGPSICTCLRQARQGNTSTSRIFKKDRLAVGGGWASCAHH